MEFDYIPVYGHKNEDKILKESVLTIHSSVLSKWRYLYHRYENKTNKPTEFSEVFIYVHRSWKKTEDMPVGRHVTTSWDISNKIYHLLPKTPSKKQCPTEFGDNR